MQRSFISYHHYTNHKGEIKRLGTKAGIKGVSHFTTYNFRPFFGFKTMDCRWPESKIENLVHVTKSLRISCGASYIYNFKV